jgi:hypothetical protein
MWQVTTTGFAGRFSDEWENRSDERYARLPRNEVWGEYYGKWPKRECRRLKAGGRIPPLHGQG